MALYYYRGTRMKNILRRVVAVAFLMLATDYLVAAEPNPFFQPLEEQNAAQLLLERARHVEQVEQECSACLLNKPLFKLQCEQRVQHSFCTNCLKREIDNKEREGRCFLCEGVIKDTDRGVINDVESLVKFDLAPYVTTSVIQIAQKFARNRQNQLHREVQVNNRVPVNHDVVLVNNNDIVRRQNVVPDEMVNLRGRIRSLWITLLMTAFAVMSVPVIEFVQEPVINLATQVSWTPYTVVKYAPLKCWDGADHYNKVFVRHAISSPVYWAFWDLECGADINTQDSDGQTALIRAANGGNLNLVKYLVSAGADVNVQDKDGDTARMIAKNTIKIIQTLANITQAKEGVAIWGNNHRERAQEYIAEVGTINQIVDILDDAASQKSCS